VVVTPNNVDEYLSGKLWSDPVAGDPEMDNNLPTIPVQ
jgi:ribose transport system substrate-binding protein